MTSRVESEIVESFTTRLVNMESRATFNLYEAAPGDFNTLPAEVPEPVHCYEDSRNAYDKEYVSRLHQILLRSCMVFEKFRSSFRGKSSPVNFFWGSFDLSETRYSGKKARPPEQGGRITKYAENEENFAIGFWAGNVNYPKPAFYSYMYPAQLELKGLR